MFQQLADVIACFIVGCHIVLVEIPVELGFLQLHQTFAKAEFHLLHHIEADKEVGVIFEGDIVSLCHLAIEHPFVGQLLGAQFGAEVLIDIFNMAPQLEETVLELAVVVGREIAEETLKQGCLLFGEIGEIVEFVDVTKVAEYIVGHGHVLVNVVEVADEQLSPAVEMVEGLVDAGYGCEAAVEFADEFDGVADGQR